MKQLREYLTLILIALLPFHAFMVTVLTRVIAGPGHAPLSWLAVWKEALLGVVLLLAFVEIVRATCNVRTLKRFTLHVDFVDGLILALLALSVIVTYVTHNNWNLYLFGFRYDFVPLVAFLLLRRVPWSEGFVRRALFVILLAAEIVALYGIASFFLPASFFTWLGYSDLHSLYVPGGPVAPFQLIGETGLRRIQSTFSGPNQFGIWLLLPLAILFTRLMREKLPSPLLGSTDAHRLFWKKIFNAAVCGIALILTFSRAAWIAALILACIACAPIVRMLPRRIIIAAGVILTAGVIAAGALFPQVIVRLSSTRGHFTGPMEAVQYMISQPFGRGMGMAGPVSNRVSDTCVLLRETDDPSWARAHPDLCVFLGDTQVQPVDRACSCPFLPENWFLQIGVEMGVAGFVLYLALIGLLLYRLKVTRYTLHVDEAERVTCQRATLLAFIGVVVAALFLHAFEDAAIAYTLWMLAAVSVRR